eukprot:2081669-Prymnesium_polylepis.1
MTLRSCREACTPAARPAMARDKGWLGYGGSSARGSKGTGQSKRGACRFTTPEAKLEMRSTADAREREREACYP